MVLHLLFRFKLEFLKCWFMRRAEKYLVKNLSKQRREPTTNKLQQITLLVFKRNMPTYIVSPKGISNERVGLRFELKKKNYILQSQVRF